MELPHNKSISELVEQIETLQARVGELEKANSKLSDDLDKSRLIENKFRLAMEATTEGLWDWNIQSGEVYYSRSWAKILGEEEVAPYYETWESRLHPDDKNGVLQSLKDHLENKSEYWSYEQRLSTSSNEWKWILGRGRVILNDIEGKPLRMVGTMTDITEQKNTEKVLKESEEKYRKLFSEMGNGFSLNELILSNKNEPIDYITLELNQAFEKILGIKREDVIGIKASQILPPDELTKWINIFGKVVIEGIPQHYEIYSSLNEKYFNGYAYSTSENKFVVIFEDITDQKRSEETLREKQNQLLEAQQIAHLGNWWHDLISGEIYWSDEFFRILGIEPQKPTPELAFSFIHPDDKPVLENAIKESSAGKMKQEQEFRIIRPDGKIRWIHNRWIGVYNKDGKEIKRIGTHQDITKRKEIEEALRESEEKYRAIFENSGEAVLLTTPDGRILSANESACRLFGRSEEEICEIGREMLVDSSDPRLSVLIEERNRTGRTSGQLRLVRKDGSKFECELTSIVFKDSNGKNLTSMTIRNLTKQIEDEEKIRRYESIVSCSTDLMALVDENFKYLAVNESYGNAFKRVKDDIIGHNVVEVVGEETFQKLKPNAERCLKGEKVNCQEWMCLPANSRVYMDINYYPYFNEDNNTAGFVINARDITSKKQAEEALKESEKRFKLLYENAPLSYQSLDENAFLIDVNPTWLTTLGYTREEVIGHHFSEFMTEESADLVKERFPRFVTSGKMHDYQFEMVRKDGSHFFVSYNGKIGYDETGHFKQTHCIFTDITERKLAEEALIESENRYRKLVELSPDAIMIHQNGKFVFANNAAVKIFNAKSKDDFIGKPIIDRVHPDYREIVENRIHNLTDQQLNNVPMIEEKFIKFDQTVFDVEVTANHFLYGGEDAVQVIARDITGRKQKENELRERNYFIQTVLDKLPIGLAVNHIDDGKVSYMNKKFESIYGWSKEKLSDIDDFFSCVYPDPVYREEMRNRIIADIQSGDSDRMRWDGISITGEDGAKKIISAMNIPIFDQNQMISLVQDITKQKEYESLLVKERNQAQQYLDVAGVIIGVIDDNGDIIKMNKKGCEILGYNEGEIINKNWFELCIQEDVREEIWEVFQGIIDEKLEFFEYYENEIITKKGELKTIAFHNTIIRNNENKIVGILFSGDDITEKKRMHDILLEREEFLSTVVENIPDMIFVKDPSEFRYVRLNKAGEELLGYNRDELLGKNDYDILPIEQADITIQKDKEVITGKKIVDIQEEVILSRDNKERILHTKRIPIYDKDNNPRFLLGISEDITERKAAEKEIYKLSHAVEQSPASVVITDTMGNIEYVNKKFVEVTGYTAEEAIGKNPRILKSGQMSREEYKNLWDTILSGKEWRGEFHNRKKNGELYWESASISPLEDKNGNSTHFIGIKEDITQRKKAELQLKQSEKQLELIYNSTSDQMALVRVEDNGVYRLISFNNAYWQKIQVLDPKVKREQILGIQIDDMAKLFNWPDSLLQNLINNYEKVIYQSKEINVSESLPSEQGKIILDCHYIPIYDEKNICTHILFTSHDITERIQAEKDLRESEDKFRTIFNESPIGIELYNADGIQLNANKASLNMFGIPDVSEIQAFNLFDGVSLDAEKKERLRRGESVGYVSTFNFEKVKELQLYKTDRKGEAFFDYIVTPLLDTNNQTIRGYLLQVQDITERKKAEEALRESEEKFRNLADYSPNMIFINKKGKVVYANRLAEEITGYKKNDLYSENFDFKVLIEPEYRELIISNFKKHIEGIEIPPTEYRLRTISGKKIDVVINTKLVNYEGEKAILGIVTDITERKHAEEALIESEARWRSLTENSADYIMLIDEDIKVRFINRDRPDMKMEDMIGNSAYKFIPHPFQNAAKHCFNKVLSTGEPGSFETEYHGADGKIEYFSIGVGPVLRSGKVIAMVCSATDITKRKLIENSLKNSYMRLRNLAERLQVVREEERAAVAREIHDDLGQSLTAIKMDVSWLQKNRNINDDTWGHKFSMLLNLINLTIQSVKKIASDLRPGVLDDLGLIPAIEWQTEEFEQRYNIKCNLNINRKEVTVDNNISIAVFRIYQETLTNIARHSKATRVDIHLDFQENKKLFIEIHDNGIGINNETAKSQKSFGILGMRERVSLLKGGMEIIGKPDMGTMVRVVIPY